MLLAIDIGNTNIVCGLSSKNQWLEQFRIHTQSLKTSDEYEVIFRTLLSSRNIELLQIETIVLSSVVPSLTLPFTEMIRKLINKSPLILGPDIYSALEIGIINPYEIGTDLVANAVAAYTKYSGHSVVVDFGTAISFTVINGNGNIMGVTIAPGLRTALASLTNRTAQLPNVELVPPKSYIGKNTIHAMQAGIVLGYRGLVESIIEGITEELGEKPNVIATGGLAQLIAPMTECFSAIEPSLTLDGLRIIGKQFYNR